MVPDNSGGNASLTLELLQPIRLTVSCCLGVRQELQKCPVRVR